MDELGSCAQLQFGKPRDLLVYFQLNLPGKSPEDSYKGNLAGKSRPVAWSTPAGYLAQTGFTKVRILDRPGPGNIGIRRLQEIVRKKSVKTGHVGRMERNAFYEPYLSVIIVRTPF